MLSTLKFDASPSVSAARLKPLHLLQSTSGIRAPARGAVTRQDGGESATFGAALTHTPTLAERLFEAIADAKVWTSRVAMHLSRDTRDRLFHQLDMLHELDEWAEGDAAVSLDSFKSFVRAILYHAVNSKPALALMPNGNILALWADGRDKLTVEFLPGNRTRWMVQNVTASGPERTTSTTPLERLRDVLQPYNAERWFDGR